MQRSGRPPLAIFSTGRGAGPATKRPQGARPLFGNPHVYDAAFSWNRDREARTFLEVGGSLRGGDIRSAVELACGTGPLARVWAQAGLPVYGVDRSRQSIARAGTLSRGLFPRPRWVVGNLRSFRLPRRVDLAAVPLDGLGYLVEAQDLVEFFRSARSGLTSRGVLAVDLTLHPEGRAPLTIRNSWKVRLRPKGTLSVSWRSQGRAWGTPRRQWEVGRVVVRAPGGSRQVFWEAAPHACLSVRELGQLAEIAGGFSQMTVFSDAAHRGRAVEPRPVELSGKLTGPHLVAWVRT